MGIPSCSRGNGEVAMALTIVPIKIRSDNNGYFALGNKFTGDIFNNVEIDSLMVLQNSIEIAIKNIENIDTIKEQQEKIDKETQKASRLELTGILAGGIAHDFNNMLTGVLSSISLAMMSLGPEHSEVTEMLNEAEVSSHEAKSLTRQLLTFSKDRLS